MGICLSQDRRDPNAVSRFWGMLGPLTGICRAGFVRSRWSGLVGWIRTHFDFPLTSILAGEIYIGEIIKSEKRIYSLYDIGKTDR